MVKQQTNQDLVRRAFARLAFEEPARTRIEDDICVCITNLRYRLEALEKRQAENDAGLEEGVVRECGLHL